MFLKIKQLLSDFTYLFYPEICSACGNALLSSESIICTSCIYFLPKTNFHDDTENAVAQLFWGRVRVEHATAGFYFHKGEAVQTLMHQLKYNGQKEVGFEMGKIFGYQLINSNSFKDIDVIIPIPLHPKREHKRSYNQSDWIGKGLSESMRIPLETKAVIRNVETETQTKKTREERYQNVRSIFHIPNPQQLENKHILLIDDVLTTGATFESCTETILAVKGTRVSIAALAKA